MRRQPSEIEAHQLDAGEPLFLVGSPLADAEAVEGYVDFWGAPQSEFFLVVGADSNAMRRELVAAFIEAVDGG